MSNIPNRRNVLLGAAISLGISAVGVASAQAAGVLTLNPSSGKPGTAVTVSGSGFPKKTKGSIVVGSTVTSITSSASGVIAANITIPAGATGKVAVTIKIGTTAASGFFTIVSVPVVVAPVVPAPSTARLRFGVATNGTTQAELDSVATLVNEGPSIVNLFQDWNQAVPVALLNQIDARGATPIITWEPWAWGGGAVQSGYTLRSIIAGNHDAYINQWAVGLKNYGKQVMLRFAHEMNGDWYPWAEKINGNSPGEYVTAWRHVHNIFTANGVTNVQWIWTPNVHSYGWASYASLFPGAQYVNIVALDGYNWGTTQAWGSSWQNPSDLFGESISLLRSVAPGKPIIIAETSSAELGGDKAVWNRALISYLNAQSDVLGLVWFNLNKEVDWRINSSNPSLVALKEALSTRG